MTSRGPPALGAKPRWHMKPRAARVDVTGLKQDVITYLKESTDPAVDGCVAVGFIRDFFDEHSPEKTPEQRANSVNNTQQRISRLLEKDASMLRADWLQDLESQVLPLCKTAVDRELYDKLRQMSMDEFAKVVRKEYFFSEEAKQAWLKVRPYKPIVYCFQHPKEERAIARTHVETQVIMDNGDPKIVHVTEADAIDARCQKIINDAIASSPPTTPQALRQWLWALVNAIMCMCGKRPAEICRGGPPFTVEGPFLLSTPWGKKQGAYAHAYKFPTRMDAATVLKAVELVRNTPLVGYGDNSGPAYLKEKSDGRQNAAMEIFDDIDFKMYKVVRGYYAVRAWESRYDLGYLARPIHLGAFAMNALGHQELKTQFHYTSVIIDYEERARKRLRPEAQSKKARSA